MVGKVLLQASPAEISAFLLSAVACVCLVVATIRGDTEQMTLLLGLFAVAGPLAPFLRRREPHDEKDD